MTREILFYIRSGEGIRDIAGYRLEDASGFMDEGVYDFSEYMVAREEAVVEGQDPSDHFNRYELATKYVSQLLTESVFRDKDIESPFIRNSEIGEKREKVFDAIKNSKLDRMDAEEFCDYSCVRMDEFSDQILVEVEEI